jgi:alkylhydroperoxidase/carboxymuconolactone decarboxylase family protein YurZ
VSTETAVEQQTRYDIAAGVLDKIFGPSWRDKQRTTGFKAVDDFQRIAVEHCYADVWARDTLDYKTRSAISMSVTATLGTLDEFKLHVEAALANGWTHVALHQKSAVRRLHGGREMLAAWYERQGPAADVLQVGELPSPQPAAGEVPRARHLLWHQSRRHQTALGLAGKPNGLSAHHPPQRWRRRDRRRRRRR